MTTDSEVMHITFRVKEYSEPLKQFIEIIPTKGNISLLSKANATIYLYLKNETSESKANEVVEFLIKNISAIGIVSTI